MENIRNEQGKLPYEKPEIEVIDLDNAPMILAGSGGGQRPDYESEEW